MSYNRPTSFSQSKMFELCPRTWYYKYVKKIPMVEDLKYAHRGNVVHNCLEEYYNDKSLSIDNIKELFEKEWKKYKLDNTSLAPYKNQTWNMIQAGIDLNLDVTSTELKIYYPDVVGYIDVVDSKTETLYDWKTSTISEDNQEEYKEQLKYYSWLYYRKFNSLPKKLQVIYLKYKDDDDKFLSYSPTMQDVKHIENWHNNIRKEMNDYVNNVKKLPPFNKEYFWSPYKHLWEVEKLKPNDMMNFNIVISGNFLFIKGYMDSFLSKHIDNKFSYELKNSHFIKMNNQHANTIVRFWHKSQKRLPIGFLKQVKKTLFDYAQFRKKTPIIEIQDLRVFNKKKIEMPQSLLSGKTIRTYQIEAIDAFVNKGDNIGILELVTGSGKSLIAAEIIRRLQTTTLFIVDKKELMYQMRDVIKEELGIEAGILGDNKKDIKDITVATIQTLIRNKKEFEEYLKTVNLAVFDEAHHTSSKSYYDIGYYLKNTEYRLGITATAYRDDGNDMAITATTGDILYSLTGQSLIEKGYLMKPKIYFITYKIEDDELLEMELESSKGYINETPDYPLNYKSYIVDNNTRNELIKKITEDKKDKSILILVKLIEHGKKLEQMIPNSKYLYGNTPKKERMNYLDDFKSGKIRVLISTISIFAEGVNIPSLDVIINASANKGDVKSIQVLGRVLRKNQGKESAEYFDFYDTSTFFYVASAARMQAFMNEGHDVFKVEYIEKKKYINKLDFIP